MTTRRLRCLGVVLAVLPIAVGCGGSDDQKPGSAGKFGTSFSAAVESHLLITTDNGVRLRPADGDRVGVDEHVDDHWAHHDDTWTLDLSCPEPSADGTPCPRMPQVRIPDGVSVTVTARNAGVDVAGVTGTLDLTTVNGDVTVTRSGRDDGKVRLSTRNGSVRATGLAAGRLSAGTTNGDVALACAAAPSGITAVTTNGSVDVTVPHDTPAYRVSAVTGNGRTTVTVPTRDAARSRTMTLTTVNGDIAAHRD
ncbi:DUF4097 family beta strand repeat-containing protein [Streptomyces sp. NPDC003011]